MDFEYSALRRKLKIMEEDYEWYFDEQSTKLAIEGIEIQKLDSIKVIGLIVKDKKTDKFDRVLLWVLGNHTIFYSQKFEKIKEEYERRNGKILV
jgi:hypothetical protein